MIKKIKHWIKNNKTIVGNIFSLWALQIFNYIIPLITLPYVLRVLWPEKFWIIAFATAFVGYFMIITNYGFNLTATKDISMNREDNKKVSEIFWNVIFIKCILAILSFFVFLWIVFSFTKFSSEVIVFIFTFLMIIWEILFPVWMFQWMEKMKYITIINIIVKSIFLLPVFLFIQNIWDYIWLPLITSLSFITTGVIAFFMALKVFKLQFILPNFQSIKYHLVEWWHVFISGIFISLYTTSTTFILWIFTNNTVVWYYASAEKLITAVKWLIWPISQAIYPSITKKLQVSKQKTIEFLQKVTILVWGFAFIVSIILFFGAEIFVNILFWKEFYESILLIKILALLPFIVALSNVFWIMTMLNFGYKKAFSNILIISAIISIIISIPATIFFQSMWMAISVLFTEMIITISMGIFLYKESIYLLSFKKIKNES